MFPIESLRPVIIYKEFLGKPIEQIPVLLSSGMDRLQTDNLMQGRLYAKEYRDKAMEKDDKPIYNNPFAINSDGEIKLVLLKHGSEVLEELRPITDLANNEWTSDMDMYKALHGMVIDQTPEKRNLTKNIVQEYSEKELIKGEIKSIIFWNRLEPEKIFKAWWDRYFHTDPFFLHPDGSISNANDHVLRELDRHSEITSGYWVLPNGFYATFGREKTSWNDVEQYANEELMKNDARKNKTWSNLAKGNHLLQNKYIDAVYSLSEHNTNMGIYAFDPETLSQLKIKHPVMGVWLIDCIENQSDAVSYDSLANMRGLVVGLNRGALEAHNKLENRITDALKGL